MIHIILFLSHTLFMIFKGQHKNAEFKKILEKAIFTKYLSQDTHHIFMTRPAIWFSIYLRLAIKNTVKSIPWKLLFYKIKMLINANSNTN